MYSRQITIERKDHEVLQRAGMIHGLIDNYREIRPWCNIEGQNDSRSYRYYREIRPWCNIEGQNDSWSDK